jgi:toxin ParE1/3/4
MTAKLLRSPAAAADLVEIWDYIADDNPAAATRMLERIERTARKLLRNAKAGRERAELSPGLRSVVCRPYVVFYRLVGASVEIVRVLHGARDIDNIFGRK